MNHPGIRSRCVTIMLALSVWIGCVASLKSQQGEKQVVPLGDNFAPASDDDLKELTAALRKASASFDACVRGACFELSCADANAVTRSVLDAKVTLEAIQPYLNLAADHYHDKLREIQIEAGEKQLDTEQTKNLLIISKALTDTGNILLTLASLGDGFEELQKGFDAALATTDAIEALRQLAKTADQFLEQFNELAALTGDVGQYVQDLYGVEHESFRPEALATVQRWKSNATDAIHVLFNFRAELRQVMSAKYPSDVHLNLAKSKKNLRASLKSAGLILGRELSDIAENGATIPLIGKRLVGQKNLEKDIEENRKIMEALDTHHAQIYQAYVRLIDREVALRKALSLVRNAYERSQGCGCLFTDYPPTPHAPEISYGELLKKFNTRVPGLTERINLATARLSIKTGETPTVAVTPQRVPIETNVSAQYFLAVCKETDDARIQLRRSGDPFSQPINLGQVKRGAKHPLNFRAPSGPGDYEVRIVDTNRRQLASDSFSVLTPEEAARAQNNLSGLWECKDLLTNSPSGGLVPVQLWIRQVKDSLEGEVRNGGGFSLKIRGTVSASLTADATYTSDDGKKASGVWTLEPLDADHFRVNTTFKDLPAGSSLIGTFTFTRVQ